MKLAAINLWRYDLPLKRPMATTGGAMRRTGLLVSLRDEADHVAWGEAAPLPAHGSETMTEAAEGLGRFAACRGQDVPDEPMMLTSWLAPLVLGTAARCAVESALLGLMAQARGVSLQRLLWAAPRDRIAVAGLIDRAGAPADAADQASALVAQDCSVLKLKIGHGSLAGDVARVVAVSDAVPGTPLRLDANRAWSPGEARAAMVALGRTGAPIEYIEEPLAVGGLLPDARLPQALDETLVHAAPAARLNWLDRFPAALILKPMMLGFIESWQLAQAAMSRGITTVISSSFETGLGLRLAAALASGTGTCAGLGTAAWFERDLMPSLAPDAITLSERPLAPETGAVEAMSHAA